MLKQDDLIMLESRYGIRILTLPNNPSMSDVQRGLEAVKSYYENYRMASGMYPSYMRSDAVDRSPSTPAAIIIINQVITKQVMVGTGDPLSTRSVKKEPYKGYFESLGELDEHEQEESKEKKQQKPNPKLLLL